MISCEAHAAVQKSFQWTALIPLPDHPSGSCCTCFALKDSFCFEYLQGGIDERGELQSLASLAGHRLLRNERSCFGQRDVTDGENFFIEGCCTDFTSTARLLEIDFDSVA